MGPRIFTFDVGCCASLPSLLPEKAWLSAIEMKSEANGGYGKRWWQAVVASGGGKRGQKQATIQALHMTESRVGMSGSGSSTKTRWAGYAHAVGAHTRPTAWDNLPRSDTSNGQIRAISPGELAPGVEQQPYTAALSPVFLLFM